jgi:hypothetical protein
MAIMAFRWGYPFACSANVRYVLGMIVPFVVLVARGTENSIGWNDRFSVAIVWSFIALSTGLYLFYSILWM